MIHYNYTLQVWIVNGRVKDCEHPQEMKVYDRVFPCCNQHTFRGLPEERALHLLTKLTI